MPATKTHTQQAPSTKADCDYLSGWIKKKTNGHIGKNLTQNGEPQKYSWGTQKKKKLVCRIRPSHLQCPRLTSSTMLLMPVHLVCVCLLVGCLTSQQHASVSQGRICSDNFTCCHTEIEAADPTFHLTQSQYTDTGPTSPSADPITPGAWQGSHWSANF